MVLTDDALRRVGIRISPAEVEALLLDVLARMRPADAEREPGRELPPVESAALARGGFELSLDHAGEGDPLARTAAEYAALLATSITVAEVATLLTVDASRVRQRLAARTLYGVKLSGEWRLPTFQFEDGRPLSGIERVLPRLDPALHPVAVARWFEAPDPDLILDDASVSPRDWLRLGCPPATVGDLAAAL